MFVDKMIATRSQAAMNTAKINAALQYGLDDLAAKRKDMTGTAFAEQVKNLKLQAEEAREKAKQPLRDCLEEYKQAVTEWAKPDGSKLDRADLDLMNLVKLDQAGFEALAEKHKNNLIMSQIIRDKAREAGVAVPHVQGAAERVAVMSAFEASLEHSLSPYCRMMDVNDQPVKDMQSFISSRALHCLENLQPMEDGEVYDTTKYVVEYPESKIARVW